MAEELPEELPIDSISKDRADSLYDMAGDLVKEDEDQISLSRYSHLLNDDVGTVIKQVLNENPLPFELAPFQLLALHALGSKQNVLLLREAFK